MQVIKDLLSSKKFVASLVAMLTAVAIRLGMPEVQIEELIAIISPVLAYIGAQGFADLGKEKAKSDSTTIEKELES